jgi:hypothetical protein
MCFNQKLSNLPPNLLYLEFDKNYRQILDNLPFGLNEIKIGNKRLIEKIPFGCQIIEI